MVRKIFNRASKSIGGLHAAAFWLACFSVMSQILALLRDRLLAHYFGAGTELDVYYAAFEVPDLIFATAASLVSISVLVPLFAKFENQEGGEATLMKFMNSAFSIFSLLVALVSVAAFWLMPQIVPLLFKGLGESQVLEVIRLSRILLLSPVFLGFSNFFGSISQYERKFVLYSFSPVLYNSAIIAAIFIGARSFGIEAAVWGVAFGAFLHMIVQVVSAASSGKLPSFTRRIEWLHVRELLFLSIPRTMAISASSIVGTVMLAVAAGFTQGSIAIFTLSLNMQSALISIIGVSYSLAAFPTLSRLHANANNSSFSEHVNIGLRHIIFWSLPISALFIILRAHIVRVVLGSGQFDWSDTRLTAAAMAIFALFIVFQNIQLFLTRAHYAAGSTRNPLFINVGTAIVIMLCSFWISNSGFLEPLSSFLANVLDIGDLSDTNILVLPLAFGLGSSIAAILLWIFLQKKLSDSFGSKVLILGLQSLLTSLCVVFVSYVCLRIFDDLFDIQTTLGLFAQAAISGVISLTLATLLLLVLRNKEILEIKSRLRGSS